MFDPIVNKTRQTFTKLYPDHRRPYYTVPMDNSPHSGIELNPMHRDPDFDSITKLISRDDGAM